MKRYNLYIAAFLTGLFLFNACQDEDLLKKEKDVIEGIPTTVSLSFATQEADKVTTKSELDVTEEYRVYNLLVFVFRKGTGDTWVKETMTDVYTTTSSIKDSVGVTAGTVTLEITSGEKRIYAVANGKDNPLMPITGLEGVETLDEFLALKAEMDSETVERGQSHLVMSGMFETGSNADGSVTIAPDGKTSQSGKIILRHLDSKITFIVTAGDGVSFIPREWKVVNIPRASYVVERAYTEEGQGHDAVGYDTAGDYFESKKANFDIDGDVTKGGRFTFYMLENRKKAQGNIGRGDYQLREKQNKIPDGDGKVVNGDYIYAAKYATYVEMTGSFRTTTGVEKSAEVKYTIHLGYEGEDATNFRSRRGCDYTYKVTVTDVNAIKTEVRTSDQEEPTEEQPGAEGDVIESDKLIYVDAHYVTTSITFHKGSITNDASFRVKTPYGTDDYEWVWFVQNDKEKTNEWEKNEEGKWKRKLKYKEGEKNFATFVETKYKNTSNDYSGDDYKGKRINIKDLIGLLKAHKYNNKPVDENSIYDSDGKAAFTVFIDEFYYEDKDWRKFVNVPNREMHILCNTKYSKDQESSLTTSTFMISQRSIKTFYDLDNSAVKTAWGVETVREGDRLQEGNIVLEEGDTLSNTNGRWNMFNYMNNYIKKDGGKAEWSDYIKSSSNTLQTNIVDNGCLQRNRDLNGDGYIDDNEVRWYLPAINQMVGMWIGRDGLPSPEVYLFNADPSIIDGGNADRQDYHFQSSSNLMFWAEEGSSISAPFENYNMDYRCARNLGAHYKELPQETEEPLDYVSYDPKTRIFDLSRMNKKAVRSGAEIFTDEIAVDVETKQWNRPYTYFKVAGNLASDKVTQSDVYKGKTPCKDYYESEEDKGTWRMPNQRELSLIASYAYPEDSPMLSRTRSTLPVKQRKTSFGSVFYQQWGDLITLYESEDEREFQVRCVKDVTSK